MIWESGGTGLLLRAFPLRVFAVPVGILLSALLDRDYAPLVYLVWIPIERVILLRFRGRFIAEQGLARRGRLPEGRR